MAFTINHGLDPLIAGQIAARASSADANEQRMLRERAQQLAEAQAVESAREREASRIQQAQLQMAQMANQQRAQNIGLYESERDAAARAQNQYTNNYLQAAGITRDYDLAQFNAQGRQEDRNMQREFQHNELLTRFGLRSDLEDQRAGNQSDLMEQRFSSADLQRMQYLANAESQINQMTWLPEAQRNQLLTQVRTAQRAIRPVALPRVPNQGNPLLGTGGGGGGFGGGAGQGGAQGGFNQAGADFQSMWGGGGQGGNQAGADFQNMWGGGQGGGGPAQQQQGWADLNDPAIQQVVQAGWGLGPFPGTFISPQTGAMFQFNQQGQLHQIEAGQREETQQNFNQRYNQAVTALTRENGLPPGHDRVMQYLRDQNSGFQELHGPRPNPNFVGPPSSLAGDVPVSQRPGYNPQGADYEQSPHAQYQPQVESGFRTAFASLQANTSLAPLQRRAAAQQLRLLRMLFMRKGTLANMDARERNNAMVSIANLQQLGVQMGQ